MAIVTKGDVLGDLDLMRLSKTREYTATCISDHTELYVIDWKVATFCKS